MGEFRKKVDAFLNHPISGEKREKYLERRARQERALDAKRRLPGLERRRQDLAGKVAAETAKAEEQTMKAVQLIENGKGKSPVMQQLLAKQAKAAKDNASAAQRRAGGLQKQLDAIEAQIRDCNTLIQAADLPLPQEMAEQGESLAINAALAREDLETAADASVSLNDLGTPVDEADPELGDIMAEMQKPPEKKEAEKPAAAAKQEAPAKAPEPTTKEAAAPVKPVTEQPDDLVITFGDEEPQKEAEQ
jgi:hypothetical protein